MGLFNRIKVRTPECVELELTLAGIGNRVLALMIDYLLLTVFITGVIVLITFLGEQLATLVANLTGDTQSLELWMLAILALAVFVIYSGYFVFFETTWQGQTPGKRFTKIRVVQVDGRPVGLPQAVLRSLLRPIDDLFFIGLIFILLGSQERRIGDWVAGTLVIQVEKPTTAQFIDLSPAAEHLAQQLLATNDLSSLRPDDFAVIREYLHRRRSLDQRAQIKLSADLVTSLRESLPLHELNPAVADDLVLEALYIAYQRSSSSA
ncbi:MAG: RDD family protein [Elainellaceae cyanobacterium]